MNYNYTYDSSRMFGELECAIKRERYDSPVVPYLVLFSQEGVYLEADADGNAVLYNLDGAELFREKANGQGWYFSSFYCSVKNGEISVRFPIQEEIDHYPNCDGEYDRYSYITRENIVIKFAP